MFGFVPERNQAFLDYQNIDFTIVAKVEFS